MAQNVEPCNTTTHKQFDFWVGDWNVFDSKNKLIGTNRVVKMHKGCVLQENWESKIGSNKGTSYNYVNQLNKSWNQVWIDNSGYSLVLSGKYENQSMILRSELISTDKGDYFNQVTWTKNKDGSVTQIWENLNKKNEVIREVFRGIYRKK